MGRIKLPVYFDGGFQQVADEAQKRDPEYTHFWVKRGRENEQTRRMMGYTPVEDDVTLDLLGLLGLKNERGRASWQDVELWKMPKELNDSIHDAQNQEVAERTVSIRAALETAGAEAQGRSGGAVQAFVTTGGRDDVVDRRLVTAPAEGKGKEK